MKKKQLIKIRTIYWIINKIPRKGKRLIVVAVSFVFILKVIFKQNTICLNHLANISKYLQLDVIPDVLVFPCIVADILIKTHEIDIPDILKKTGDIEIDDIIYNPKKQTIIAESLIKHLPSPLRYTDDDLIAHDIVLLLRNIKDILDNYTTSCKIVMNI